MEIVRAEEHGLIPIQVDANTKVRRDLLRLGLVEMRTGARDWAASDRTYARVPQSLYAGSMVGLLPLNESVSVLVEPRFPANLTAMVNAVGAPTVALDVLRTYGEGGGAASDWMLDRIAQDYVSSVERVLEQGLLRTYSEHRTTTSSPKGRILIGVTLARHAARGMDHRVEVAYHERTEVNPPNQALVEGLHWVLEWSDTRRSMSECRQRTSILLNALRHVPRDRGGAYKRDRAVLEPRTLPPSRSAYERALRLAIALVERQGFSLDAATGLLALTSLLVKTDEVFEAYVRLMLSQHLQHPTLQVVDGNTMARRSLFTPALSKDVPAGARVLSLGSATIKPDVLLEQDDRTRLVVDVKYKPVVAHAGREDVLQQLVTYAHRLRCRRAVSVHPTSAGQEGGLYVSGRIGKTTIYNYRVNLAATDIDQEMRRMAVVLGDLARPRGGRASRGS